MKNSGNSLAEENRYLSISPLLDSTAKKSPKLVNCSEDILNKTKTDVRKYTYQIQLDKVKFVWFENCQKDVNQKFILPSPELNCDFEIDI